MHRRQRYCGDSPPSWKRSFVGTVPESFTLEPAWTANWPWRQDSAADWAARHDGVVNAHVVSILARPVYGVAEAAGLLGLRPDRTRAWLDGYERHGVRYPPVIREAHTGDDIVFWGEFVELGYLREYRRCGVPLQWLRPVIDELRREFSTPYPLATARPYVMGRELVLEIQERNDLPPARSAGIERWAPEWGQASGKSVFSTLE